VFRSRACQIQVVVLTKLIARITAVSLALFMSKPDLTLSRIEMVAKPITDERE
jgi:hypothetical protein